MLSRQPLRPKKRLTSFMLVIPVMLRANDGISFLFRIHVAVALT